MRLAVFEGDPLSQLGRLLGGQGAEGSGGIFALDRKSRMHHGIRQLARRGEDQQPAGADIQAPDRQPARAAQSRQFGKHGFAPLRVFARDNFAFGLVINQHPRRLRRRFNTHRAAIDLDAIFRRDARADGGRLVVDRDAAGFNPGFHRAARADACLRQHLLQLLRFDGAGDRLAFGSGGSGWQGDGLFLMR